MTRKNTTSRKSSVQKRLYYKIGEACKALDIQPYVLRYWETEFPALKPSKSKSGQRVYGERELEVIRRIKQLLYDEGYTIAGAKKRLETELASGTLGPDGEGRGEGEAEAATAENGAGEEAPAAALDTGAAEKIQTLRHGIEGALGQAREILALLR